MADDVKESSITNSRPSALGGAQPVEQVNASGAAPAGTVEDKVRVQPLKYFREDNGDQKSPDSEPYETSRSHAAELRANGLVDYLNDADADREFSDKAQTVLQRDRDRRKAEEKARGPQAKPLLNPQIDMAKPPASPK